MKTLKIWITVVVISIVLALVAIVLALYQNLNSQWLAEQAAAQYALNHSPISHIDSYQVFTGDGMQDVFEGTDIFAHKWYAFVSDDSGAAPSIHSVPAAGILSKNKIEAAVKQRHIHPIQITLGYVNAQNPAIQTTQSVVWEVYGTNAKGKHLYEYFDAKTGKLVWQYVLST